MKMKNLLIGGMSLALVACISIGGTLAYLQAEDDALTNTFKFANNITVDLYEYQVADPSASTSKNQTGYDYTNLVPGEDVVKNVDVTLKSSVKTDLYILIDKGTATGANQKCMELNESQIVGNEWEKVEIQEADKLLYKKTAITGADAGVTYGVFETVKVPAAELTGNTNVTLKDVKIDVFAVQSDNLGEGVTADSVAAGKLGVHLKAAG